MLSPRIVVATDGSPAAETAVTYAADLGVAIGAKTIVVLCVDAEPPSPIVAYAGPDRERYRDDTQIVEKAAEVVRAIVGDRDIAIEPKVVKNPSAAAAILQEAGEGPELSHIVMGNGVRGGLESLHLGSECHQVAQGARCPVTIVRG